MIPNRLSVLTSDDLRLLRDEVNPQNAVRYQAYLDKTRTGLEYHRLSTEEQKQVRRAVNNPHNTLAGPELLIWNNIRRQRRMQFRL